MYYYACYLPSIGYPLANSYFTEAQLQNIQRKAMSIIIAKCGYNRNTKKAIIYGPLEYGGGNFRRLYDQQGIGQVHLFMQHWRKKTTAGKLLRCAVEWAQYCIGTSIPFLEDVTTNLPHFESKWLKSLRENLSHINAGLQVNTPGVASLERHNDTFIMDRELEAEQFTNHEIQRINYCRLYLGALPLADLATTSGDRLDQAKLAGNPSLVSTVPKWMRIHQDKPSDDTWKLWKQANALWSLPDGTLTQSLGPWLVKCR